MGSRILRAIGLGDLSGKGWKNHFSFWSLIAFTFFLFADQQLVSPNMSRIGEEFGFVKKEDYLWYIGSLVSLFFFPVAGLIALGIGISADQFDRKKLLIGTVILGEIPCILTAFAPDYKWFLFFRTLTGIGVGGIFPIVFSMLGDYFRTENRPTASGFVELAMGLGMMTGQVLGGELAHTSLLGLSGWRVTFLIVASPAIPLAVLYFFIGDAPRRGESESAVLSLDRDKADELLAIESAHKITLRDFRAIFTNRTNIFSLLQGIPGMVAWGFLFVYVVDFYEKTKGFDIEQANLLVISFGLASVFGGFLAGMAGRAIYRRSRAMLPIFCSAAMVLGAIPVLVIVNYEGRDIFPMLIAAAIAGILVQPPGVNVRAVIMNTNVPENRGSMFSIFGLTDKIGAGFGPFMVGLLVRVFGQLTAYNIAVSFWFLAALLWLPMIRTMVRDEDNVALTLKNRVK